MQFEIRFFFQFPDSFLHFKPRQIKAFCHIIYAAVWVGFYKFKHFSFHFQSPLQASITKLRRMQNICHCAASSNHSGLISAI